MHYHDDYNYILIKKSTLAVILQLCVEIKWKTRKSRVERIERRLKDTFENNEPPKATYLPFPWSQDL